MDCQTTQTERSSTDRQSINTNIGISRNVYITFTSGNDYIQIKTYEKSPSGEFSETAKKSFILPLSLFRVFVEHLDQIKESFEKLISDQESSYKLHLGNLMYLQITKGIKCVDLRQLHIKQDILGVQVLVHGHPGLGFRIGEFQNFLNLTEDIIKISDIYSIPLCSQKQGHNIKLCDTCNPHGLLH